MLKFIVTAIIVYTIYKFFIAPRPALNPRQESERPKQDDGEYVDYEEVDD